MWLLMLAAQQWPSLSLESINNQEGGCTGAMIRRTASGRTPDERSDATAHAVVWACGVGGRENTSCPIRRDLDRVRILTGNSS